ncbi:MAG: hypothetical protein IKW08_02380 [Roseburia sp.]|nr:hypothetical protein [Roseburia sp.]
MNWTSILSQIFFAVSVTSITGTAMLFIWFLCRNVLQKINPKLVYYMLRWVVVMFLLPVTYVAIQFNYNAGYVQSTESVWKTLFVINMNNFLFQGIAVIWLIVTIVIGGFYLRNEIAKRKICRNNFEDGMSLAQTEFERIKEVVGVKGKVLLLRNDDPRVQSPFVTGMFCRKLIIPYREYTKEELKVILYHELNHIKKSDVFFRYLTVVAVIVNSINPLSYLSWSQILLWSEADCDARALDGLEAEGISKSRYYDIIWKLMESGPAETDLFYYPMLASAQESLYRRMLIMENYRVNMRKVAKSVTFAWVMVFAMLSTVTAHAAGVGVSVAADKDLIQTQNVAEYGGFGDEASWSEEIFVPANDSVDIVYINDGIMTLGSGTIDWSVPAGTRYVTSSIYMTKGTIVSIACTARPSTCVYWFGIMAANSDCHVVEGSGSGSHDFTVPSSGWYRIMVENRSIQSINVVGGYTY